MLDGVEQHFMGILLRDQRIGKVPVVHGRARHHAEAVFIIVRHDDFLDLPRQRSCRVTDEFALHFVPAVDNKGEAFILRYRAGLDVAAQIVGRAIALHAAADIVVQRRVRDAVDDNRPVSLEIEMVARDERDQRLLLPPLIDDFGIGNCQIHTTGHNLYLHKVIDYLFFRRGGGPLHR